MNDKRRVARPHERKAKSKKNEIVVGREKHERNPRNNGRKTRVKAQRKSQRKAQRRTHVKAQRDAKKKGTEKCA